MKNITVQQILEEYNLSFEELKQLLLSIGEDIEISKETHLTLNVVSSLKDYLSSNDKTSTYSEGNTSIYSDYNDTTQAYSDNPSNKTGIYESSELNEAAAYNSDFNSSSGQSKTASHGIGIGDSIILKNESYRIIDIISEGTGEAIIYKVENNSNQTYALKLYFEFSNSKHEPNAETLERIKRIEHKDILNLVDFGVGPDKYQNKYCFEICEFAKGGDLLNVTDFKKKYTPSFIENRVIPEIFDGIKQLHSNKIFHCDLKPGNIFYLDEKQNDLIIGDYGSAKAYELALEGDVNKTSLVKGSEFYLAPELGSGNNFVSPKADYFSFGMILLHLLYPDEITKDGEFKVLDKKETNKIGTRGFSSEKLINYNPIYARINKLIEGLTLYVAGNRWGQKEVEKWLSNEDEDIEVKYLNSSISERTEVKISGGNSIKTEEQLLEFVFNSAYWKSELLQDETTKQELFSWLNIKYGKDKRVEIENIFKYTEILDAIDKNIKDSEGIDYTKEAFIRSLKPEFPIVINELVFKITEGNIVKNVNDLISKLDSVWQTISIEKIRYTLFQLEFTLKQLLKSSDGNVSVILQTLLNKIYSSLDIKSNNFTSFQSEITKVLKSNEEEASLNKVLDLFSNFNENRVFSFKKNKCNTLEELSFFIINNESEFENKYFKVEKNWFLKKKSNLKLSNLNSKEFVFEIFRNEAKSTIEYIGLTFDKHRDYNICYKCYKSLTEFLKENKVTKEYTSRSDKNETFNTKRNLFEKFTSVADRFIIDVKQKHNITNLSRSNENNISDRIIADSWRQYFKVYQGQLLAAGCLILLLIIIGVASSNNSYSSPTPTKPSITTNSINNEYSRPINKYAYIKADPIGNIRSGTSTEYNILTALNKGDQVYVIEQDKATDWYKVRYGNNKYGYVSDIVISFDFVNQNDKAINNNITSNNNSNKELLNNKKIIGEWDVFDNHNTGANYIFYSNGTGNFIGANKAEFPFKWNIDSNTLRIVLNNDNSIWNWNISAVYSNRIEMYSEKQNISRIIKKKVAGSSGNTTSHDNSNIQLISKINNVSGNIKLTKSQLINGKIKVFAGNNELKVNSFKLEFDTQPGIKVNGNVINNQAKITIGRIRIGEKVIIKNIMISDKSYNSMPSQITIELISEINDAENIVNSLSNTNQLFGNWEILGESGRYVFYPNDLGNYIDDRNRAYSFKWELKNNNRVLKIIMDSDNSIWRWEVINPNNNAIKMRENSKNINRTIVKR